MIDIQKFYEQTRTHFFGMLLGASGFGVLLPFITRHVAESMGWSLPTTFRLFLICYFGLPYALLGFGLLKSQSSLGNKWIMWLLFGAAMMTGGVLVLLQCVIPLGTNGFKWLAITCILLCSACVGIVLALLARSFARSKDKSSAVRIKSRRWLLILASLWMGSLIFGYAYLQEHEAWNNRQRRPFAELKWVEPTHDWLNHTSGLRKDFESSANKTLGQYFLNLDLHSQERATRGAVEILDSIARDSLQATLRDFDKQCHLNDSTILDTLSLKRLRSELLHQLNKGGKDTVTFTELREFRDWMGGLDLLLKSEHESFASIEKSYLEKSVTDAQTKGVLSFLLYVNLLVGAMALFRAEAARLEADRPDPDHEGQPRFTFEAEVEMHSRMTGKLRKGSVHERKTPMNKGQAPREWINLLLLVTIVLFFPLLRKVDKETVDLHSPFEIVTLDNWFLPEYATNFFDTEENKDILDADRDILEKLDKAQKGIQDAHVMIRDTQKELAIVKANGDSLRDKLDEEVMPVIGLGKEGIGILMEKEKGASGRFLSIPEKVKEWNEDSRQNEPKKKQLDTTK